MFAYLAYRKVWGLYGVETRNARELFTQRQQIKKTDKEPANFADGRRF
jgi:hypothetical protein